MTCKSSIVSIPSVCDFILLMALSDNIQLSWRNQALVRLLNVDRRHARRSFSSSDMWALLSFGIDGEGLIVSMISLSVAHML